MADNFETNIARRIPNTSKSRPIHPWDVPSSDTDDKHILSDIEKSDLKDDSTKKDISFEKKEKNTATIVSDVSHPSAKKKSRKSKQTITDNKKSTEEADKEISQSAPHPLNTELKNEISKKHIDLSDKINIHSNYCKLDNDISDHLLGKLSPSAQSVYLRLYRQSFGWNRNWAAESLPKLKNSCNLSLQTVRKAIRELESKGCIQKEFSDYHKATVYRVFLPSEIGIANNAPQIIESIHKRDVISSIQKSESQAMHDHLSHSNLKGVQYSEVENNISVDLQNLEGADINSWGQKSAIQSVYFSGTSIYALLESGGALPKNISIYITDKHLIHARDIIDEFYDSIGFSVVSRAQYRKSIIDYFDIIKSGFSPDDIKYAVRWTFKNSRSRPESFSLIKYTIHDAMNDLISELKDVSGEKERVKEKKEALLKKKQMEEKETSRYVNNEDLKTWLEVVEELKESLNVHSFSAFIEPLKLDNVDGNKIVLIAPPDSVSWIVDHFLTRIQETYRNQVKKDIIVEIR